MSSFPFVFTSHRPEPLPTGTAAAPPACPRSRCFSSSRPFGGDDGLRATAAARRPDWTEEALLHVRLKHFGFLTAAQPVKGRLRFSNEQKWRLPKFWLHWSEREEP